MKNIYKTQNFRSWVSDCQEGILKALFCTPRKRTLIKSRTYRDRRNCELRVGFSDCQFFTASMPLVEMMYPTYLASLLIKQYFFGFSYKFASSSLTNTAWRIFRCSTKLLSRTILSSRFSRHNCLNFILLCVHD